jgi:hypothetical protein
MDAGECRSEDGDRIVWRLKAGCCTVLVVLVAGLIGGLVARATASGM